MCRKVAKIYRPWCLCPAHHTNVCKISRLWGAVSLLVFNNSLSNLAILLVLRLSFRWSRRIFQNLSISKVEKKIRQKVCCWKHLTDLVSSDIKHRISKVRHQTSDIKHWTSKIRHGTSNIEDHTSDIRHRTLDILHRTSNMVIKNRTSNIGHRISDIGHGTSNIRHWTWDFKHQASDIGHKTSVIRHRRSKRNSKLYKECTCS